MRKFILPLLVIPVLACQTLRPCPPPPAPETITIKVPVPEPCPPPPDIKEPEWWLPLLNLDTATQDEILRAWIHDTLELRRWAKEMESALKTTRPR